MGVGGCSLRLLGLPASLQTQTCQAVMFAKHAQEFSLVNGGNHITVGFDWKQSEQSSEMELQRPVKGLAGT